MSIQLLYAAATADPPTFTVDRLVASVGALVSLAAAVIGWLALTGRLGRYASRGPITALLAGTGGLVIGALILATADGGPGTGNGVVGGAAAIVFGLVAVVLGRLAQVRSRRAT